MATNVLGFQYYFDFELSLSKYLIKFWILHFFKCIDNVLNEVSLLSICDNNSQEIVEFESESAPENSLFMVCTKIFNSSFLYKYIKLLIINLFRNPHQKICKYQL